MAIARHKTRQRELREARALLRRVQRGDARAFALLYATYEGRIYRLCHRLTGRPETATALVELTFSRALANLPDERSETLDVPAYLYGTARGLASERNGDLLGSRGAAESEVSVANDRLSPAERAVLALRDLEGRPDNELAAALDVPEATVPGLVGAARLHLLGELRPPGMAGACPGRLSDLSAYADGMLPAERRTELEAHVTECADCRGTLYALREAALRYRSLPVPEPPGELGSRITRALGLIGLPARNAAAAEPGAGDGRQTAAAVAMAALAVLGVAVTIAASRDDTPSGKPASARPPAPSQPAAQASAPASGGASASGGVRVLATRRPPALHHARAGAKRVKHVARPARAAPRTTVPPGLGQNFAPESPVAAPSAPSPPAPPPAPSRPLTTPKPARKIPVEIVPPVVPSQPQSASDQAAPPPAPPAPPPPPQTTTT